MYLPIGDNMAKFKCLLSNTVYEFTMEHDIKTMRTHPEYEEVKEEQKVEVSEEAPTKRVGRPPKDRE